MFDPREGVGPDGTIRTGADQSSVPPAFEALLAACVAATSAAGPAVSTYLYGSVATGMASTGTSDVDILTVGLSARRAELLGRQMSERFAGVSRGVEIAVAQVEDFAGDGDEAYGNRVFLRHYCLHLSGSDIGAGVSAFPADVRATRGFNGDIALRKDQWLGLLHEEIAGDGPGPKVLGRRCARKTLLAVAGLVSVHDSTWTTDRGGAARRWAEVRPAQAQGLRQLDSWSRGASAATQEELAAALHTGGIIDLVQRDFRDLVGLWA